VDRGWQRKAHLQIQRSDGGPSDGVPCVASFSLDQNHSTNSDTVGHTSAMTTTLPLAARRRVGKEAQCHLRGLRQVVPPLRKAYGSVVQMPPPASPYNMSKWQEAKEKRNRHSIARLTKALPVVYPANVLSRALNAVMKSQIFSIGNAVFFVFCFKQTLATTPRRFHLEIIRCLESQSAGRGHHRTSVH
jgi:hypothetical protein